MGVVQTFKLIKLYASDVRSSLCISYTSVKLLKKNKTVRDPQPGVLVTERKVMKMTRDLSPCGAPTSLGYWHRSELLSAWAEDILTSVLRE